MWRVLELSITTNQDHRNKNQFQVICHNFYLRYVEYTQTITHPGSQHEAISLPQSIYHARREQATRQKNGQSPGVHTSKS